MQENKNLGFDRRQNFWIFGESRQRSLVKSLIYRILSAIGVAILLSLAITNNIKQALTITIVIQIFLIIFYYCYERIWNKISWGREIKERK